MTTKQTNIQRWIGQRTIDNLGLRTILRDLLVRIEKLESEGKDSNPLLKKALEAKLFEDTKDHNKPITFGELLPGSMFRAEVSFRCGPPSSQIYYKQSYGRKAIVIKGLGSEAILPQNHPVELLGVLGSKNISPELAVDKIIEQRTEQLETGVTKQDIVDLRRRLGKEENTSHDQITALEKQVHALRCQLAVLQTAAPQPQEPIEDRYVVDSFNAHIPPASRYWINDVHTGRKVNMGGNGFCASTVTLEDNDKEFISNLCAALNIGHKLRVRKQRAAEVVKLDRQQHSLRDLHNVLFRYASLQLLGSLFYDFVNGQLR